MINFSVNAFDTVHATTVIHVAGVANHVSFRMTVIDRFKPKGLLRRLVK